MPFVLEVKVLKAAPATVQVLDTFVSGGECFRGSNLFWRVIAMNLIVCKIQGLAPSNWKFQCSLIDDPVNIKALQKMPGPVVFVPENRVVASNLPVVSWNPCQSSWVLEFYESWNRSELVATFRRMPNGKI